MKMPVIPHNYRVEGMAILVGYVTDAEKVTYLDLRGPSRNREFVEARMIIYALARELLAMPVPFARRSRKSTLMRPSYASIGSYFNRDHATVLHGVKQVRALREFDKPFNRKFCLMREDLNWIRITIKDEFMYAKKNPHHPNPASNER